MKWVRALVLVILILILTGFRIRTGQIQEEKIVESLSNIQRNQGLVAGVASTAVVPPNPVNLALEQVLTKENELIKREQAIKQAEAQVQITASLNNTNLAIIILFVLLIINFTFDYKRSQHQ